MDLSTKKPNLRPERPGLRPERPDLRPDRLDLRPKRLSLRPERPDLRSQRPDLRPEGPDEGGTNGRTNERTDERKSPCVLQDFVPFGAAAQKKAFSLKTKLGKIRLTWTKWDLLSSLSHYCLDEYFWFNLANPSVSSTRPDTRLT